MAPRRRAVPQLVLPLVAVACAGLAVSGAVLNAGTDRRVEVTRNLLVNRPTLLDAYNSPTIVRNPRDRANLVVSYRVDRPQYSATLQSTFDEGATWKPTALPLPAGLDRPFAPDVAFTSTGDLYVVYSNLTGNGNTPEKLWVARSTDGGGTLGEPVAIAGQFAFQPRIAVGGDGSVYVTWLQADTVGVLRFAGAPARVMSRRSTDGGRTFGPAVAVSDQARARVGAAVPVVDGKGRLRVLYEDFKGDRRDFENLEGPVYEGTFALVLATSPDHGATFLPGREVESGVVPGHRFFAFLPDFPSFAAGPGGALDVAWADARAGSDDVYLRHSGDGGKSWTAARRVNDNPAGDGTSQYLPRVAVAADGRVDVLYFDRRRDRRANVMTDVWLATSASGKGPFESFRVSDRAFDSRVGPEISTALGPDFGTRLGLVDDGRTAVAVWTDTRFGTQTTGRQDIVGAAVQLPAATPLLGRVPVVAGFVALGLAALVAWRLRLRAAAGGTDDGLGSDSPSGRRPPDESDQPDQPAESDQPAETDQPVEPDEEHATDDTSDTSGTETLAADTQ